MPRDLFGNVTRPSISIGNRKWYTLPLSLFSHSAIVLLLIAIPILAPAVMPSVFADAESFIVIDVPKVPPPPPLIRTEAEPIRPPGDDNAAPIVAPVGVGDETPKPEWREADVPSVITGGISNGAETLAPPPPPPIVHEPVRVGGAIRAPIKINSVNPVYPPMAMAARVQGIVIIEATIGADGQVINARILRSVALLDQAAIEAVRQWQFTPTMLNGVPVPVIMTVTVNFTLK